MYIYMLYKTVRDTQHTQYVQVLSPLRVITILRVVVVVLMKGQDIQLEDANSSDGVTHTLTCVVEVAKELRKFTCA